MDIQTTHPHAEPVSREEAIAQLLRVGSEVRGAYQRLRAAQSAPEARTRPLQTPTTGSIRIAAGY